jgi:hypothetical protein
VRIHSKRRVRINAHLAVIEGGEFTFIHADNIGRPVFATNSNGVKVWSAIPGPRKRARAFGGKTVHWTVF